jgi:hypothetical protein
MLPATLDVRKNPAALGLWRDAAMCGVVCQLLSATAAMLGALRHLLRRIML